MKTIIVGLGNPILGDDGIGWRVAAELQRLGSIPAEVTIEFLAVGGISLMEALIGYDRAIIVDAIVTHQNPVGSVRVFKLDEMPNHSSGHMGSPHDASLPDALRMGRALSAHLPDEISIVTIESQKVYDFSEALTPPVEAAIPEAIHVIRDLLIESYLGKPPVDG